MNGKLRLTNKGNDMQTDFFNAKIFKEVYERYGERVPRHVHNDMRRILVAYSAMDIMLTLGTKSPIKHNDMDSIVIKSARDEALSLLIELDYLEATTWKGKEAWQDTAKWRNVPLKEKLNIK
jgi:hypothetical protein